MVGSTTKKYLSQRMDNHRNCYKRWKDGKTNKFTDLIFLINMELKIVKFIY